MAGTMIHMAVAMHLLKQNFILSSNKLDNAYFIAGNIAPDGIQCHKNYCRPMKLHTHLRDDIPDLSFHEDHYLQIYHERLQDFANTHLSHFLSQSDKDTNTILTKEDYFYFGYFTHLLTDEHFMCTVRQEFMKKAMADGYSPYKKEIFDVFTYDTNQVDFRLAQTETLIQAKNLLSQAGGCEFPGMLSKEILEASRNWVFKTYFETPHTLATPKYISYERMTKFISNTTKWIIEQTKQTGIS